MNKVMGISLGLVIIVSILMATSAVYELHQGYVETVVSQLVK